VQRQGGKSCRQGAGSHILLGEPAHQRHGSGGHGLAVRRHRGSGGGGLRRQQKGRGGKFPDFSRCGRAEGYRDSRAEKAADRFTGIFGCAAVLLYGTHDVGLAAAGLV